MHDKDGKLLKIGDIVNVPCVIKSLSDTEEYCNIELTTIYGRRPDGKPETICAINTGVVLLNFGAVAVCSLGRVGVITDKKTITFSNGDTGEMYVGMGLDGKGLWASSDPIKLCDTLKEYTERVLAKPSNVLYGTIAVDPPKREKNDAKSPGACSSQSVCPPGSAG